MYLCSDKFKKKMKILKIQSIQDAAMASPSLGVFQDFWQPMFQLIIFKHVTFFPPSAQSVNGNSIGKLIWTKIILQKVIQVKFSLWLKIIIDITEIRTEAAEKASQQVGKQGINIWIKNLNETKLSFLQFSRAFGIPQIIYVFH